MFVDLKQKENTLCCKLLTPRIDGSNHMLDALNEFLQNQGADALQGIHEFEIDFGQVEYLNSSGISELVNIYRLVTDRSRGQIHFRFVNVRSRIHSIMELVEFTKLADVHTI